MSSNISINSFTDYRTFLLSHAQVKKKENKRWTYGIWAKQLGLSSTSSITKIIQGDRNPGDHITDKLISYFKFNGEQADYFKDLIRLHKVKKDPRMAVLLLEKMGKDHPDKFLRTLKHKEFEMISSWYCLAIREMTRMDCFFEDPYWISKNFNFQITKTDVSKALKNLLDLGLLKRGENGELLISEGRVQTSDDMMSEAVKRYHEDMLDNAKLALRKVDLEKREFTGSSLIVSEENLPQAKKMIRDFRSKFNKTLEEESGNQIYQFQIQFFPLTKFKNNEEI